MLTFPHSGSVSSPRHERLIVMLPPAHSAPQDYLAEGFGTALQASRVSADLWLPDINADHVMARTVLSALQDEVLTPARAAGYREIWLGGISMGGHNALLGASAFADELAGLCLIAPYTGTGDVIAEIRAAGGAQAWAADPATSRRDERVFWHWLVQRGRDAQPLPIWFGCGSEDRFARNQAMMAELLRADEVHFAPGRHDWPTWLKLWRDWLTQGPLRAPCAAPAPLAHRGESA